MKANPDKYHMLVSKNGSLVANIDEIEVSNTKTEKLLGVTFGNRLTSNNFSKKSVIYSLRSLELHPIWIKIRILFN